MWKKDYRQLFINIKEVLKNAGKLYHPNYSLPWVLQTDASQLGIGGGSLPAGRRGAISHCNGCTEVHGACNKLADYKTGGLCSIQVCREIRAFVKRKRIQGGDRSC